MAHTRCGSSRSPPSSTTSSSASRTTSTWRSRRPAAATGPWHWQRSKRTRWSATRRSPSPSSTHCSRTTAATCRSSSIDRRRPSSARTDECRSRATQPPDLLGRPAPRPVELGGRTVRAGRVRRGPRLDEVLDDEAIGPEQSDPFAVGQLEPDILVVLDLVEPEVVEDQAIADLLGAERPADRLDRRVVVEGEQPAGSQQP